MWRRQKYLAVVLAGIVVSLASGAPELRINGLDATVPLKVEGKENLMISVAGAGDVDEQSYSVICGDRGRFEPVTGPSEVNATAYRFVFDDDWELGTVSLIADQNMGIDGIAITAGTEIYKLHLCYSLQADTTTAIGIDFEGLSWVAPEPQAEQAAVSELAVSDSESEPALQPTTTPYSHLEIKPRQEKEKVLRNCPQVSKRSKFAIPDVNGKGQTITMHDGSVALSKDGGVIDVTSDITTNTLWTADNVYHVLNPIDVNNALLVIEPGTMVAFAAGANAGISIVNNGVLVSRGIVGNEIIYTSDAVNPNYEDYYCPIYITETASTATQVKYSIIEWAYAGVVVFNRTLENDIESNYFVNCVFGVLEYGLEHTNVTNNLFYGSGYGAIEIYMESLTGQATAVFLYRITPVIIRLNGMGYQSMVYQMLMMPALSSWQII